MNGAFLRRRDRTARPLRVGHYSSAVNTRGILKHVPASSCQLGDTVRDAVCGRFDGVVGEVGVAGGGLDLGVAEQFADHHR